jgi:hypothetical protein
MYVFFINTEGLEDGEGEEAVVVELSVGRRRKADELWKVFSLDLHILTRYLILTFG